MRVNNINNNILWVCWYCSACGFMGLQCPHCANKEQRHAHINLNLMWLYRLTHKAGEGSHLYYILYSFETSKPIFIDICLSMCLTFVFQHLCQCIWIIFTLCLNTNVCLNQQCHDHKTLCKTNEYKIANVVIERLMLILAALYHCWLYPLSLSSRNVGVLWLKCKSVKERAWIQCFNV